jgi:flagellar export protein FliJ
MFRFRLQRVLDMRERTERDAATALVAAEEQAELARAEQEQLRAARDVLAHHALANPAAPNELTGDAPSPTGDVSVGALRTLQFLLGRLDERVETAASAAAAAEGVVSQRQDALRSAFRDRRALDRLREKQLDDWKAAASAADRNLMDDIALSRFTQGGADKPGAPRTNTSSES